MRLILHMGMHKTGTSSIQDTYFRFEDPSFEYIKWGSGNHCGLFILLFEDIEKLEHYHGFAGRGAEFIRDLPRLRKKWRKQLEEQIVAADKKTLLFSAEDISGPMLKRANERLAAFFCPRSDHIDVIGYARSPLSFMASAFQQRLKGGTSLEIVLPAYRARFEKIDVIFGRDSVTIREFSRDRLTGGDVVQDFATTVGIATPPKDRIIRSNDSLSLEATALLYVQRKFGMGFVKGFNAAHQANKEFIAKLSTIGTRKLSFSDTMVAPFLDRIRDDIAWMEHRLGHPFSDSDSTSSDAISTLDDLVEIALQNYDKVLECLDQNSRRTRPATVENLVNALEVLREVNYNQVQSKAVRKTTTNRHKLNIDSRSFEVTNKTKKATEEEMVLRRKVANILWHLDMGENMPASQEDRNKAFKAEASDYMKKAAKLVLQFKNHKLELNMTVEDA